MVYSVNVTEECIPKYSIKLLLSKALDTQILVYWLLISALGIHIFYLVLCMGVLAQTFCHFEPFKQYAQNTQNLDQKISLPTYKMIYRCGNQNLALNAKTMWETFEGKVDYKTQRDCITL